MEAYLGRFFPPSLTSDLPTPRGGILPIFLLNFQLGLQCCFKGSDGDFYLFIRLWMSWGRVVVPNPELGTEIPELRIVELFPIV